MDMRLRPPRLPIIQKLKQSILEFIQPVHLLALPMRLVDHVLMKAINYLSFVIYYPVWLWRNKSIRNVVIWVLIASFLILEYLGVAALIGLYVTVGRFAMAALYMIAQFALLFVFLSGTKNVEMLPGDKGAVTFGNDFFGQEHIKEVVLGTLAMMSQEQLEIMQVLGADPPHGAVLTGPPGTGKTLIAQCAASEINVPYIGMNGADFSAMFIGVGEMKVKGVRSKAQRWADQWGGCIVFIDEIDAVASSRGGVEGEEGRSQPQGGMLMGGGMGIRSQLLTAMDGTKELQLRKKIVNFIYGFFGYEPVTQGQVFWLGATNRLGAVDSAFLRPGRMDMIIQCDPPDKGSRRQIIQGYVDQITHDDTVDVERLTDDTQGVTPADIAGAVKRTAARFTIKGGRTAISMLDIESALMEQVVGVANPIAEFDEGQKEQVATHEAGHAVISARLLPEMRVTSLSIIRRGKGILGFMRDVSPEELYAYPLSRICARIQVSWAGDIACEVLMGERWTGGTGDFSHVNTMMRVLAGHGYFADRLPLDMMNPFADKIIEKAANRYSERVKATDRRLISENRPAVEALRDALIEKGELNSADIYDILERHGLS